LVVQLPETKGHVTVTVLMSPEWEDGASVKEVTLKPLKDW